MTDYNAAAWPQTHWQIGAQVGAQMGAQWQHPQQHPQQQVYPEAPAISQMLVREADAWRALLGLHGSVLNLARGISSSTLQDIDTASDRDEQAEASEQREAAYVASVTQLIAQCDQLVAEAVKIRGLRKTKCRVDAHTLEDVLRPHSDEALAVGEAVARNGALSIASATSELRQGTQAMRVQIQQARALLTAATERAESAQLPRAGTIVMGIASIDDATAPTLFPVATVLEHVYQRGVLNDQHLGEALLHDPHTKLAEAASSMEVRISQLECRAASERAEAKRLVAAGQKTSALRALKRAKATEKQLEANQQSLMAIEAQVDMMAQAQMQKQLATALASSSKGMKGQKKLLKSAEAAVDDASDARDMADDLSNVMAEFAQSSGGNEDEDELMAELNSMLSEPAPHVLGSIPEAAPSSSTAAEVAETARKEEIALLEARLQRWDEASAVRDSLPAAPIVSSSSSKAEEKVHLLPAAVQAN